MPLVLLFRFFVNFTFRFKGSQCGTAQNLAIRGFNLLDLHGHRKIDFSAKYEKLASSVLELRYLRGDSLIYGLGVPFLLLRV